MDPGGTRRWQTALSPAGVGSCSTQHMKKKSFETWSSLGSLRAFHQEIVHVSPGHSPEPPHIAVKLSQLKAGELLLGWRPQQMFLEFEEGGRHCMQVLCCFIRSQLHSCPASPFPCPAEAGRPPEPFASLNLSSCLLPEHPATPARASGAHPSSPLTFTWR